MACDLSAGRLPLPGGRIHETGHWLVEHCVGPLGLGTLIVKPQRHVTAVAALTDGHGPSEDLVENISHRARTAFAHRWGGPWPRPGAG